VQVIVTEDQRGKLRGLCGNYDGDIPNDRKTKFGVIASNWEEAANSWKTDDSCPNSNVPPIDLDDPCKSNRTDRPNRSVWAKQYCSLISDETLAKNPFRDCIQQLPPSFIKVQYANCLYDACK
jgi:hypothetical protein